MKIFGNIYIGFFSLFPFVLRQRKVAKPVNLQKDALPHTHIYVLLQ